MNQASELVGSERGAVQFPTVVDNWLVAVLVLALVVSMAAVLIAATEDPRGAVVAGVILLATFGLILLVAAPTHYTIDDRELRIRSGVLHYRIPLDSIRRVYPTRNPLSAPAWSLDRLGVEHQKKGRRSLALISPARREEFMQIMAARAGLVPQGDELRRTEEPG